MDMSDQGPAPRLRGSADAVTRARTRIWQHCGRILWWLTLCDLRRDRIAGRVGNGAIRVVERGQPANVHSPLNHSRPPIAWGHRQAKRISAWRPVGVAHRLARPGSAVAEVPAVVQPRRPVPGKVTGANGE